MGEKVKSFFQIPARVTIRPGKSKDWSDQRMVHVTETQLGTGVTRKSFGKIREVMKMPNLIQVQKDSYQWFLDVGLKEVLRDVADITDYTGNLVLSFVDYRMEEKAKYSVRECKERVVSYSAPMRVTARLYNKETGEVKESEVYMGNTI